MSPSPNRRRRSHYCSSKIHESKSFEAVNDRDLLHSSSSSSDSDEVPEEYNDTYLYYEKSRSSADETYETAKDKSESGSFDKGCLTTYLDVIEYSRCRSKFFSFFNWIKERWIMLFSILLVILILFYTVKPTLFNSKTTEDAVSPLNRYHKNVQSLLREKYPLEKGNTKGILRLIGEKWIDGVPKGPDTILVIGEKAKAFAFDIASAVGEFIMQGEVNRINCYYEMERSELDAAIASSLSEKKKSVILNDIDRLRGIAPLSLHSLCDHENSPFSSALIILTVTRSNFGQNKDCEQKINELLLDEWTTGFLNEDKISPILSRITSFVICLRS